MHDILWLVFTIIITDKNLKVQQPSIISPKYNYIKKKSLE